MNHAVLPVLPALLLAASANADTDKTVAPADKVIRPDNPATASALADHGSHSVSNNNAIVSLLPPPLPSNVSSPCLTKEECEAQSNALGLMFYKGDVPKKGCYCKNAAKGFWSPGSVEEMSI